LVEVLRSLAIQDLATNEPAYVYVATVPQGRIAPDVLTSAHVHRTTIEFDICHFGSVIHDRNFLEIPIAWWAERGSKKTLKKVKKKLASP
jgi:hypothetical protein